MTDINKLVITEMIGIKIRPAASNEIGPNAKVEARNLGTPKDTEAPQGDPDFYKNFPGDKFPVEKTNTDVPTDLSSGMGAGERLKNAIKSKHSQNK